MAERAVSAGPGASRRAATEDARAALWMRVLLAGTLLLWAAGLVLGFDRALAAVTLIGFVAAIGGLARPALGLMGIGILCAVDGFSRSILPGSGLYRWNTFNYWLLLVILIHLPRLLRLRDVHSRLLALFVLVLALGIVISPLRSEGMETTLSAATAFGLLVYALRAGRRRGAWLGLALTAGANSAAAGLVFLLQRDRFPSVNPNVWVFCPLTGIFAIAAGLSAARRPRTQLVLGLLATIDMVWVFLTGSRGGIALGLLGMAYLLFVMRGVLPRFAAVAAGILLASFLTARFAGLDEYSRRRLDKALDTQEGLRERTSGRSDLVLGAWYMFLDHPLGVGTGGFAPSWAKLGIRKGMTDYAYGAAKEAHAAWAKTLAENGILGFGLLFGYVGSFAVSAIRRSPSRKLALLTSAVLFAAFFSTEFAGKGLWLLAGAATAFVDYFPRAAPAEAGRRVPAGRALPAGAAP
ncbi:MAG TPA: O-antigen ligase family protein [Thermoanaerobaculia bacterium]|nr:O-antigen ligase family protein [Thermoanaerobaculia bacterium]